MTAVILADIGGTHARFALAGEGGPQSPQKYHVADFAAPADALKHYADAQKLAPGAFVRIATAANPDANGVWRFTNNQSWVIDRAEIEAAGFSLQVLTDDFAASAHGALRLDDAGRVTLKKGAVHARHPRMILGPGTGLGLAYMHELKDGRWHVQQTLGGHMLAAPLTDEHVTLFRIIQRIKGGRYIIVPEDVASGRGLPLLYSAVCTMHGYTPHYESAEMLLANAQDPAVVTTLRLFHEGLGLFAHHALVTGHAYGGIYLDGGVVHRLRATGLFDFAAFEKFMCIDVVPAVKYLQDSTPVWLVDDPYVALRGLMGMYDAL